MIIFGSIFLGTRIFENSHIKFLGKRLLCAAHGTGGSMSECRDFRLASM